MGASPDWQQALEQKLAAAAERKRHVQEQLRQQMAEAESRWKRFGPLADRLVQSVLRPRMEQLAARFDNAEFLPPGQGKRYHCTCRFHRTERFPAEVTLDLSVGSDWQAEHLIGAYDLEILPVFFRFDGHSEIAFPFDEVDEGRLARWVEERLLQFVDTYLRLEELEPYQRENLTTDPVCGMALYKNFASARAEHQGKTYFFCSEECRNKFLQDPPTYLHRLSPSPGPA